jgi:FAD/FMN-containing dehydrogenase
MVLMPVLPPALPAPVADALRQAVGERELLVDPDRTAGYAVDWTGRYAGATPAVVRPADTAQVAAVLAICAAHGIAVVPQGGNTGLVGGSVPLAGEVVLSLARLREVGAIDPVDGQLTAAAGAPLASVHQAAAAAGWAYAVDFAARDTATIGGTVATNAGGVHVLRHGSTRGQLTGIEAVLADGRVVSHLAGLGKDNTGYDLAGLVCGSEGTLAVVTAARLRLVVPPDHVVTALVALRDVADAVAALGVWRRALPGLQAAELVLADGLETVCEHQGLPRPFPRGAGATARAFVLVEVGGASDPTHEVAAAMDEVAGLYDVAVATDPGAAARLWCYRERHTVVIGEHGPPHKLDVTIPAASLAEFCAEVPARVPRAAPAARTWLFGHLGDGNIHVNVTGVDPGDVAVDEAVLGHVLELGGSISAEHGIGTAKRRWLTRARSPVQVEVFRSIKAALDPAGILNPNVLLP